MTEADTGPSRVKICGITNLEDARFVSGALADFIGFIFYSKSPRFIEPSKAGAIINWIEGPAVVGVFVNQPLDDVNRIATETGIDYIQLHGTESPAYCNLIEKPVIKTFHIDSDVSVTDLSDHIQLYSDSVDYFMFDTKSAGEWGGTGKTFDWNILNKLSGKKPFFLSGGLHTANIQEAITRVRPFAVDVSSGLEKAPGLKDYDKVEAFFEKIRKTDR